MIEITSADVKIYGLNFDGENKVVLNRGHLIRASNAHNLLLEDVKGLHNDKGRVNGDDEAIFISNSNNVIINRVNLDDVGYAGIKFISCNNTKTLNTNVTNARYEGITYNGTCIGITLENVEVSSSKSAPEVDGILFDAGGGANYLQDITLRNVKVDYRSATSMSNCSKMVSGIKGKIMIDNVEYYGATVGISASGNCLWIQPGDNVQVHINNLKTNGRVKLYATKDSVYHIQNVTVDYTDGLNDNYHAIELRGTEETVTGARMYLDNIKGINCANAMVRFETKADVWGNFIYGHNVLQLFALFGTIALASTLWLGRWSQTGTNVKPNPWNSSAQTTSTNKVSFVN